MSDKYKCKQSVIVFWNDDRLLAFTLDENDICIACACPTGTMDYCLGKDKTYIGMAMASIFHYPGVWHIRPES